ncbi:ABC transporter permease [Halalkalibacter kiskunsagensis]|uniref:ABC transporter permease n=1 Tax=Halalkalibacter kiskunsagensis TaxID=1548599 RepID=A0ABV6K9T2_9BACI
MGTFLKKDILILLRDRSDLLILLMMPFILLTILGFALRGLLGGDTEALNMKVALVELDNEQAGVEQFIEELEHMSLPEEVVDELRVAAADVSPLPLLHRTLDDKSLQDMIEIEELEASVAKQALLDGEVAAILIVPEEFTYSSLQRMLFNEGEGSELSIMVHDHSSLQANTFQTIIDQFVRTLNFETAISMAAKEEAGVMIPVAETIELGGIETVSTNDPINSFQYYTIAMAVMFVLFAGSTISSKAYVEKTQHVFYRILLSGKHPFVYLSGKVISTIVVVLGQLLILFSLSGLIFQPFLETSLEFWLGMALISLVLAICVGGFAALLTSLVVRFNSDAVSHIFSGGIVSIFAFAGGSFMPVSEMPAIIGNIGSWTPNGAALSAYLQWMQGFGMSSLLVPLGRITGMALVLLLVSIFIFPRRRSI